ncbi:hypothetical protein PMAYCL1PPCAC_23741, partial [Pristionchus mayeri]
MSEFLSEKELKAAAEEAEKTEKLRQAKLDEARTLISDMKISCTNAMPPPIEPGSVMKGTIDLQTNLFGIQMAEDLIIYKYDVVIGSDTGRKFIEFSKKGRSE